MNNPTDALKKANIDPSFFNKIRSYLNNPVYSVFLPMIGLDKNIALEKINSLEQMMGKDRAIQSPKEFMIQSPNKSQFDDLDRFKRGLKSFK